MNHRYLASALALCATALTPPILAQTAASRDAGGEPAFIEAFNRGDRAALADYVRGHFSAAALAQRSADRRVEELLELQRRYGRLTPQETSGVSRMTIVAATASGHPLGADIVLLRDSAELDRIAELWIHPATEQIAASP